MDMGGMQGMDASGGSTMAGMDHAAMGHDMPTGGAAAGGMAGMDMGSGASMPTTDKTPGGSMASMPGMGAPAGDAMAGMAMGGMGGMRSEEHTSELQSLMRISYAVFCLKKKTKKDKIETQHNYQQT